MTSEATSGLTDEDATRALRRLCIARERATLGGFALGMKKGVVGRPLYRIDYARKLKGRLEKGLRDYLDRVDQLYADGLLRVRPYASGMNADENELFYLDPSAHEAVGPTFEALRAVADLPAVGDVRKFNWSHVQLQSRIFEVGEKHVTMIRKASVANVLKRPGKMTLVFREGVLDVVDEHGIVLDEGFDAFLWDGIVFVKRTAPFEVFFEFYEKLEEEAEEIIQAVHERIPIQGLSELVRIARNYPTMLRKIQRISRQPYFARLTIDDVERVAKIVGKDVRIEGAGAGRRLVFDKSDRLAILKLLDDDFAQALLSGAIIEVRENAKHTVRPAP